MDNHRVDKFIKNPRKALFSLAWPIALGMLIQALYNVIDTIFVGRLGAEAVAAITFSFPLFFFIIAINSGVATGMSSRISRYMGQKKIKLAENTAMHGIVLSIIISIILFIVGYLSLNSIFHIFGADQAVIPLAQSYFRIILYGIVFMFITFTTFNVFIAQGDTKTPVWIQVFALLLNIVLDYVFIYVLGYGVSGAAIATTITFAVSMVFGIILIKTKSQLQICFSDFKFSKKITIDILRVGAPASLMMIIMSIYIVFINKFMAHFSTEHVAAFGIVSRLETFAIMPIAAFSLALMTLTGMFYGAKKYQILKDTVWYGLKVVFGITSVLSIIFFIFATPFLRIFTPNQELISIGVQYMRINVFTIPLMAIGQGISRIMQGLGLGLPGLIINLTRIIFVAIPFSYICVYILDLSFIWIAYSMVIGGVVAVIVAVPWLIIKFRNIN
jgi:putative MATE family efflux protein